MDRRIVRDDVAVGGEAADDQEVPVGAGEKEAGQDAVDRRDKGDTRGDEALRRLVELGGGYAGVTLRVQHPQAASLDRAGRRHALDLLRSLLDDQVLRR